MRWLILFFLAIVLSCKNGTHEDTLRIAVAANAQFAIDSIAYQFTRETNTSIDIIVGSSGKLTAQIMEGAPYDVFISADLKYPQSLFEQGLLLEQPVVYARGKLILWSNDPNLSLELENLDTNTINHLAIANPKLAPYGMAAMEALQYYQLEDALQAKLVFGESIAQTNQRN